ncbi:MAG: hypothetical protein QXH81_08395 [Thermofilaceae archaeon]
MAEEKVIVSVEQNEYIPVSFSGRFPVINPKVTHARFTVYTGLAVEEFESKKKYIVGVKGRGGGWGGKGFDGNIHYSAPLPRGAIVAFTYTTGTHSNLYHSYTAFFVVTEGERDVTLKDEEGRQGKEDVAVHVKNLKPLDRLTPEEIARIEADFANKYNAKPSKYDPSALLYHYWVEKGLAQPPKPTPPPPPPPVEEGEPFELAVSAPAAPAPAPVATPAPAPAAVPTAVETVTPPAPAAEAALVEEARVELRKLLAEQGYVVCKVVAFDLPSEYKGAVQEQTVEEGVVIERRRFAHDPKTLTLIRSYRRRFYELLHECAFRTPIGWILIAEPPKELQEAVEQLQKLAGGEYTVLEIPLPQLWVKGQAMAARERLAASLEEVSKTLADEAISNALRRRLERRKKEIEAALSRLSLFLSALR